MEIARIQPKAEVKKPNNGITEMYLYGAIGSGWFSDISSKEVKWMLSEVTTPKIELHLHSNGGDVFESVAIYNLLKHHPAEIEVHIDGIAASGASMIAMAGNKIVMPRNTMMMIHRAWTFAVGNSDELRKTADDMDKINNSVTESYMARFNQSRDILEELLKKEEYLTAQECLDYGFADEIADPLEEGTDEEDAGKIIENRIAYSSQKLDKFVAALKTVNFKN